MSEPTPEPSFVHLAIETSQREGGVALQLEDGRVLERTFPCGGRESDLLVPSIDAIVEEGGITPSRLEVVSVSIGPGGFTGLRIAISTAKALARGTGCALVPVPSAWVVAERWFLDSGDQGAVLVASAAKGTACWLTRLDRSDDGLLQTRPPGLFTVQPPTEEVMALSGGALILADDHVPEGFLEACSGRSRGHDQPRPSPRACLAAGRQVLARTGPVPASRLEPLYPREPEAVTLWRRRHS